MDSSVKFFKDNIFFINQTKQYPITGPVILTKVLSGCYGG